MKYRKIIPLVILTLFIGRFASAQDSHIQGNFPPPVIPPVVYAIEQKKRLLLMENSVKQYGSRRLL